MKDNPIKGDWIHLVVDDLKKINMSLENEKHVQKMTKKEFKDIIMEKTRIISFNEQVIKKASHEKVKNMSHASLTKPESYLTSDKVTNKLSSLIFNLRCRSQKEFKTNFNKMYECKLCPMCQEKNDSQEHALSCRVTSQKLNDKTKEVKYEDLFGDLDGQLKVAKVYQTIIKLRTSLLAQEGPQDRGRPGL